MGRRLNSALVAVLMTLLVAGLAPPGLASSKSATPHTWETGQVVVGVRPNTSRAQLERSLRSAGARLVDTMAGGSVAIVEPREDLSAVKLAQSLADEPAVRYAEPERRVRALLSPDDPSYPLQWGLPRIGAPRAWDVSRGAGSVSIAVIDSGIDHSHPDLAWRVDTKKGWDFVEDDAVAQDAFGHGTHVAGIIAANADNDLDVAGLADGCTLIPLRVLDERGNGTDTAVAQAIRWAADKGADIINLSLGTPEPSTVMEEACDYAIARGCIVVAASGNSAAQAWWTPGQIQHPASHGPVVAVGAIDRADTRARFSEWGSALDLVAPGVNIVSLYPRASQATISGTSMAAAHVSGVAALILSYNPGMRADEAIALLMSSAEDLGAAGKDYRFGSGLVRADVALGAGTRPGAPPADDDIPGVVPPVSPIVESLDADDDPHDVYRFVLGAGDTLNAILNTRVSDGFVLNLYPQTATSVSQTDEMLQSSSDQLHFTASSIGAGTYYLDVSAQRGRGEYRVDWFVTRADGSDGSDGEGDGDGDEGSGDDDTVDDGESPEEAFDDGDGAASGGASGGYNRYLIDSTERREAADGPRKSRRVTASGVAQGGEEAQPPAATAQLPVQGDEQDRVIDPFVAAVLAVGAFAALGLWRLRTGSKVS